MSFTHLQFYLLRTVIFRKGVLFALFPQSQKPYYSPKISILLRRPARLKPDNFSKPKPEPGPNRPEKPEPDGQLCVNLNIFLLCNSLTSITSLRSAMQLQSQSILQQSRMQYGLIFSMLDFLRNPTFKSHFVSALFLVWLLPYQFNFYSSYLGCLHVPRSPSTKTL